MISNEHIDRLLAGRGNVIGSDGEKIGGVGQVYADDDTGRPNWVTVRTGLFGTRESFVPLQEAWVEGEDLVVPYTKDHVKDAPGVDPDGHLDPAEEDRLYQHYRLAGGETYTDASTGTGTRADDDTTTRGTVGHDTSGRTTDDAMTRSEEQKTLGTAREHAESWRFRHQFELMRGQNCGQSPHPDFASAEAFNGRFKGRPKGCGSPLLTDFDRV